MATRQRLDENLARVVEGSRARAADQVLLAVLSDTAPDDITAAVANSEVFTTGSWYYRLGRAVPPNRERGVVGSIPSP